MAVGKGSMARASSIRNPIRYWIVNRKKMKPLVLETQCQFISSKINTKYKRSIAK